MPAVLQFGCISSGQEKKSMVDKYKNCGQIYHFSLAMEKLALIKGDGPICFQEEKSWSGTSSNSPPIWSTVSVIFLLSLTEFYCNVFSSLLFGVFIYSLHYLFFFSHRTPLVTAPLQRHLSMAHPSLYMLHPLTTTQLKMTYLFPWQQLFHQ